METLPLWFSVLLGLAIVLGGSAGAFLFFRSPKAYIQFGKLVFRAVLPYIISRNSPEIEKKMQDSYRRGEEWDNFKKRPKDSK
jgi:zinc transporter ZupT